MKKKTVVLFAIGAMSLSTVAWAAPFTTGDIVVSRVGTGSAALSSAATAVFLDEYTTAGALVQTLALPTADSGSQHSLTTSGSATSEGGLMLSADGHYLTMAGYDAAPGTASIASSNSTAAPRVVAVVNNSGSIDTTTALNALSGNNVRSAVSNDGSGFWVTGPGGMVYATLGATTATSLGTTNGRIVNISNGQLYVSTSSGTTKGVAGVGTGLPTSGTQTATILPGMSTTLSASSYDFYFADANTLYVADDGTTTSGGGLQKWTQSGGTWTRAAVASPGTNIGLRGLTGEVASGVTTLFGVTTDNKLVSITDNGSFSSFSTLVTGATNTALRGVAFAPAASSATDSISLTGVDPNGATADPYSLTVSGSNGNYAPGVADTDGNNSFVRIDGLGNDHGTVQVLIDLEGTFNASALATELTGNGVTVTNVTGNVPGLAPDGDFELLASFPDPGQGSPLYFNYSLLASSGAIVDRVAVVPEPTAIGLLAVAPVIARRRRRA